MFTHVFLCSFVDPRPLPSTHTRDAHACTHAHAHAHAPDDASSPSRCNLVQRNDRGRCQLQACWRAARTEWGGQVQHWCSPTQIGNALALAWLQASPTARWKRQPSTQAWPAPGLAGRAHASCPCHTSRSACDPCKARSSGEQRTRCQCPVHPVTAARRTVTAIAADDAKYMHVCARVWHNVPASARDGQRDEKTQRNQVTHDHDYWTDVLYECVPLQGRECGVTFPVLWLLGCGVSCARLPRGTQPLWHAPVPALSQVPWSFAATNGIFAVMSCMPLASGVYA